MPQAEIVSYIRQWAGGLDRALQEQNVPASVVDSVLGPQTFTFRCKLLRAADLAKLRALNEQLALTMAVSAVRVSRHAGLVDVEVSLPAAQRRTLDARSLSRRGRTWVAMGRTSTGQAVHVNLAGNRTPHALISGTTGSGKSVSQRLIAWNLARGAAPNSQQYLLIDGKGGVQWHGFEREAHLAHPIIGDSAQAVRALLYSLCELDRRKATGQRTPQLFVIVDEVKEILDMDPAPVGETIRRIASLGRELGIHLVLSTQYPLVDALGGAIAKANLPLRLTGRVLSAQDAYIATGIKNTGAELLNGNGDFVLAVGSEVYRLQIAMVGDAEIAGLERSTEERHIDLDDPDPQHILNVAGLEPLNPQHIGLALAYGEGIKRLQARLKVGQERATRVREFAAVVQRVLEAHGRRIAPTEGVELQEAV